MKTTTPNRSPDSATAIAEAPAAPPTPPVDQGMTVEITTSMAVSFGTGCLNPGQIVRYEDAAEAAAVVKAGLARASDKQHQLVMPSSAKTLEQEAARRRKAGDEVLVMQGHDPDIHEQNVEVAKAQREQEEKAAQTPKRVRGK